MIAKGADFSAVEQQPLLVGSRLSCWVGTVRQATFAQQARGSLVIPLGTPVFVLFCIKAGAATGRGGVDARWKAGNSPALRILMDSKRPTRPI